jgi:pimeloyl-ACP methyl ester carboxylesterase
MSTTHAINTLEAINIGGTTQWVLLRGKDTSNPVLLLIQQGPGLPMINEAAAIERNLHLEEEFVVAYWDQRACGKSFRSTIPSQSMTIDQSISDTHEMIQALTHRFATPQIYVAGFSWGGTIAALTAAAYPEQIHAAVTVGMDILFDESERYAYEFAVEQAFRLDNRQAMRDLQRIGPPPHLDSKRYDTRVKWVANFGGANTRETYHSLLRKTLWQLLSSRIYSLADIGRTLRGLRFTLDHLLPELAGFDLFQRLPQLDVPIYMLQGRRDRVASSMTAERYYHALNAHAGKQLIWFDDSAHMPYYEDPTKFREVLLKVKQ